MIGFSLISAAIPEHLYAQTEEQIKSQIEEHGKMIQQIEKDIAEAERQKAVLSGQEQTLQTTIKSLDIDRQQTTSQINLTETRISSTNLKLEELSYNIEDTEQLIALDRRTLEKSLRNMAAAGEVSIIEQVFSSADLTEAWSAIDDAAALNAALRANVENLTKAKEELTYQLEDVDKKKAELTTLKGELTGQKNSLDVQKSEKDRLLSQTKNQESVYQDLITRKKAERALFEAALSKLENSLKAVGQAEIPTVQTGVLAWPYSSTFAESCVGKAGVLGNTRCITQYFGNTAFATANAQIYNGSGHNAIDIGMPVGTPVLAALSGTVVGTGNTDIVPGCYSFGKWVAIKHPNGLATSYSHLSSINVSVGQSVTTGQTIGLSGMTGFATGPHLHFSVYASIGLQIMDLGAWRRQQGQAAGTGCSAGGAVMPVAPPSAYLNPMSYL
ncbi:MAG: peptidoglycan DD-metalloendopeptidase family protein [Nitrospirota bacterium]|nr:peptidoglycan DD-metalloendopeptidase family protein [Nitrospirota bacterium]